jgi:hypothetical protein
MRELAAFAGARKAQIGADKVFDFSLGNPSIPAPPCVNDAIRELLELDSIEVHGYTTAAGLPSLRKAIADEERKMGKLIELYYADAISIDEFISRRSDSDELVRKLTASREELSRRNANPQDLAATAREVVAALRSDEISAERKNDMLRGLVERIGYEELGTEHKNRSIHLHISLKTS